MMRSWSLFRFHIEDGINQLWERHIDLSIIDLCLDDILNDNGDEISPWRFHRRHKPSEHFFDFDIYSTHQIAIAVETRLLEDSFVKKLQSDGILKSVKWFDNSASIDPSPKDLDFICDPNWNAEVKETWPIFAQCFSDALRKLVAEVRMSKYDMQNILAMNTSDKCHVYGEIENRIAELWLEGGAHAYLHHLHAVFGYHPMAASLQLDGQKLVGILESIKGGELRG